jgi:predicted amidohydrolase YtcJ
MFKWGCAAMAALLAGVSSHAGAQPADMLFTGGRIWTADTDTPLAQAVAVRGDSIVYVGSLRGAKALIGPKTERVSLKGRMLMPGMFDGHVHPMGVGMSLTLMCDVSGINASARILMKLKSCAEKLPQGAWLLGRGWALGAFPGANPTRQALDAVLPPTMPALIIAEDGHNTWANTEAIRRAKVTGATPDPTGGLIEREADGTPSGTFRETADGVFDAVKPRSTPAQERTAMIAAMGLFNRYGITSFTDAGIGSEMLSLYRALYAEKALTARVNAALWVGPEWSGKAADLQAERRAGDPWFQVNQIKLMVDGVMEVQTAALSFPYPSGKPTAKIFFAPDQLAQFATQFEEVGYQLHFHVVGDLAVKQALSALEASRITRGRPNNRPILSHNYLIDPADTDRLKTAGAVLQFTMLWDQQNDSMVQLNKPLLTAAQYAELMPMARMVEGGVRSIGGSDAPVGQSDPFASIEVGVTGGAVPYFDGGDYDRAQPIMPGKRVPLEAMLRAYTIDAAYAVGLSDQLGSVTVGKKADLVMLDRDIFKADPTTLDDTRVMRTIVDGKTVWQGK